MYKLSIVIPCYNGQQVLAAALESLLNQEMVRAGMVEIIVIDDGSTDRTSEVLEHYADRPHLIRRHVDNGGAARARNTALDMATGEWLAFLDADDLYLEGALDAAFAEKLGEYGRQEVDIVRTPWVSVGGGMSVAGDYLIMSARNLRPEDHHLYSTSFASCLYRRAFVAARGIRFLVYSRMDVETSFRYLAFAHAERTVIDNGMMFYACRDNGASSTHTCNDHLIDRTRALAYFDLSRLTPHPADRQFLLDMALDASVSYWKDSAMRGGNDLNGEMRILLRKMFRAATGFRQRMRILAVCCLVPLGGWRRHGSDRHETTGGDSLAGTLGEVMARLHDLSVMAREENSRLAGEFGVSQAYANRRIPCRWRADR